MNEERKVIYPPKYSEPAADGIAKLNEKVSKLDSPPDDVTVIRKEAVSSSRIAKWALAVAALALAVAVAAFVKSFL